MLLGFLTTDIIIAISVRTFVTRCHKLILVDKQSQKQGCTNMGCLVTVATNFVWWCLIFVGLQYGTCCMSPFQGLEFWKGSHFWKICAHLSRSIPTLFFMRECSVTGHWISTQSILEPYIPLQCNGGVNAIRLRPTFCEARTRCLSTWLTSAALCDCDAFTRGSIPCSITWAPRNLFSRERASASSSESPALTSAIKGTFINNRGW